MRKTKPTGRERSEQQQAAAEKGKSLPSYVKAVARELTSKRSDRKRN